MPTETTPSDLSRAKSLEPDQQFPDKLQLRLIWFVDGTQRIRQLEISSDEFFGRGSYGAPLSAESLIQRIEIMRRRGAPTSRGKTSR